MAMILSPFCCTPRGGSFGLVPFPHDTHFLSYKNRHIFPIVIYSMLLDKEDGPVGIRTGSFVCKFAGP